MTDDWADPHDEERLFVTALPGSRVQIVEQSTGRLVLFIPGGGYQANALGCFAIIWNIGVGSIAALAIHSMLKRNHPFNGGVAIIGLMVLVGLGIGYYAIRLKFERTLLFVERERAALRKTLFGWTRTQRLELEKGSVAALAVSYEQNDQPVQAITLNGLGGMLRFGTALSDPEKHWVVDRINEVIGARDPQQPQPIVRHGERCVQCGGSLGDSAKSNTNDELTCPFCGHVHRGELLGLTPGSVIRKVQDAEPEPQGPFPDEIIRIVEQSADRLEFWMRAAPSIGVRVGLAVVFGFFAVFWNGITWAFVLNVLLVPGFEKIIPLLFATPFVLIGAAMILGILYVLLGYESVMIDRERVRGRWGIGPFRYSKTIPTDHVERVTVEAGKPANQSKDSRVRVDKQYTAYIRSASRSIPIAIVHETNTAAHVARLVRGQFETMGIAIEQKAKPEQQKSKKRRRKKS